jgi:hypothetical protein
MRWWLILLAVVVCATVIYSPFLIRAIAEYRQRGWFEARTRLPSLPPTAPGDDWLAALPVRVRAVEHRRRERGRCTCQAAAFAKQVGPGRVTISVSPSSFAVSHGAAWRTGLGRLRGIVTVQQAYGLLSRSHFTTSVDNLPIPSGWRHNLRLVFADHSSVELIAGGRHNARLFVETFTRLHDNVDLRILGTLSGREPVAVHALADEVNLPVPTLQSHLGALAGCGAVHLGSDVAELTDRGRHLLATEVRHIAAMARFVQTDALRSDFTGG